MKKDKIYKDEYLAKVNKEMKNTLIYKITNILLYLYFIISLSVFIIPKDILSRCEFCLNFTNFMKKYFINIEIFANASSMPQVVEFYMSLLWVVSILLFLVLFTITFYMNFIKRVGCYSELFITIVSALFFYLPLKLYMIIILWEKF